MPLTSRQSKILKWSGYPLLAVLVFTFVLAQTFPYDRLKNKIIEQLSKKYDVSIVSIEPSLVPGTFVINTIVLRTRPKFPGDKPVMLLINELEVNIGVLSAVMWSADMAALQVQVDAKINGGTLGLKLTHNRGNKTLTMSAHTKMLPMASIPGVRDAVGLPMTGGLSADFELALPRGKWSKADGSLKFSCTGCTVGDGIAKMKMKPIPGRKSTRRSRRRNLFAADGVTVPKINLGAVVADIEIKKGVGTIKMFSAKSNDGFLKIDGKIDFKDPFPETMFPGCMSFGFSEDFKVREPKFSVIEATLPPKSRQEDGSFALPTKGKLVTLRFDVRHQCHQKKRGSKSRLPARKRPQITTAPKASAPKTRAKGEDTKGDEDPFSGPKKSTASGPHLGADFREIKKRAKALSKSDRERERDEREDRKKKRERDIQAKLDRDPDDAAEDEGEFQDEDRGGGRQDVNGRGDEEDDDSDNEPNRHSDDVRIID